MPHCKTTAAAVDAKSGARAGRKFGCEDVIAAALTREHERDPGNAVLHAEIGGSRGCHMRSHAQEVLAAGSGNYLSRGIEETRVHMRLVRDSLEVGGC